MSTVALSVRDLSVSLNTADGRKQIVDSISFNVEAGQAAGLVGESGCGKTMTALAIMGLLPGAAAIGPSASIRVNGREISALGARQKRKILGRDVAMVFQQPGIAFDPVFSIGQQISAVYSRHVGGGKQHIRKAMLDSLENVGFSQAEEIAAAYPFQLSGGMCQLAMIAMAMVCKPSVIIADEPTTALDGSSRALILQQLEQLRVRHNVAILLISHDLTVVNQCCHDVMVMYCGRLVERTDSQSLFSHPRHPYSAGLLSCIPTLNTGNSSPIASIPGQVPRATELPPGCHFYPRCKRSETRCEASVPAMDSDGGSDVACFRPL